MDALQQMTQLQPQQQQQQQSQQITTSPDSSMISSATSSHNQMQRRKARIRRVRKLKLKNKMSYIPESSLHDYARWIEERGSERTEQEQKFLWKYQKRRLIQQDKLSTETLKDYVQRLLQKDERTEAENRLIRQYHRQARRKMKRDGKEETQIVVWKRVRPNTIVQASNNPLTAQMAALKESMDKMGLSAQKLRDVKMD